MDHGGRTEGRWRIHGALRSIEEKVQRLLIVGAGGFGREVLNWAMDLEVTQPGWRIGGFLDANADALNGYETDVPILGDPAHFEPAATDCFVCALGNPDTKRYAIARLLGLGARFVTLIHPTATIGKRVFIGDGCVVCPQAVVTADARLGRNVVLNLAATVGHDVEIGDWSTMSCHVDVTGKAIVGASVFAGSHACILPGVKVGDRAIIGAGSVVTRNVSAGTTVFGVPARTICTRSDGASQRHED